LDADAVASEPKVELIIGLILILPFFRIVENKKINYFCFESLKKV
jgi:hypothetical protein